MKNDFRQAIVLEIKGHFGGFTAELIKKAIQYWCSVVCKRNRDAVVIVDLSRISMLDSLSMQAIAEASAGGNVVYCGIPPGLKSVVNGASFKHRLSIYESVDEAVTKLGLKLSDGGAEWGERRQHPRIGIYSPTRFRLGEGDAAASFEGVLANLSAGGALIQYIASTDDKARVEFSSGMPIRRLDLSMLDKGLEVNGRLAWWSGERYQTELGISFEDQPQDIEERISTNIRRNHRVNVLPRVTISTGSDHQNT